MTTLPADMLDQVLAARGLTWEAAAPAITRNGDSVTVDESHPAWTGKPRPKPTPLRYNWPARPDQRWLAFHAWTRRPVTDRQAFESRLNSLADGMGCNCTPHYQQARASRPVDWSDPWKWGVDLHNDISRRLDKPTYTYEQAEAAMPLEVYMAQKSGGGMGDTIVGLYAACGLVKSSGRRVLYHARWSNWITMASYPGLIVLDHEGDYGIDMSGGWDGPNGYQDATRNARSRLTAYCANAARGFALPAVEGVRPNIDRHVAKPTASGKYAVIAPFTSGWPEREWQPQKFGTVAAGLVERGYEVIAVGSPNQEDRMAAVFGSIKGATWRWACSPDEITALILNASLVVGNDSGIVHLGGLLGTPTIAVHAGSLPHEYLFDLAPSVRSVVYSQRLPRGGANKAALHAIDPTAVLDAVAEACVQQLIAARQGYAAEGSMGG